MNIAFQPSLVSNHSGNPGPVNGREFFEIQTLESLAQHAQLQNTRHQRLECHEITWFKSGNGSINTDSASFAIQANDVYCFQPGQLRRYEVEEVKGYRLSFSPGFLFISAGSQQHSWMDVFESGVHGPVVQEGDDMSSDIEELVLKMQREFARYEHLRTEILSGLLNIMMIHFSRKCKSTGTETAFSKDADLVRRFKTNLKKHFISMKLVSDYASELCVTPNYLNRTVKKITGLTASHHIQQHIVLEAKRQAIHSNFTMKEIAYFLGFDNLAHFSKFFKNNSGMNFTSFKRTLATIN